MAEGPVLPEQLVWRALRREVDAGHRAVLAVVVSHEGSSPGRAGWLMAVGEGGWLAGTTGGGVAEAAVVDDAVALLRAGDASRLLSQVHRPGARHASGLACGGEQVVTLVVLDAAASPDLVAVDAALARGDAATWEVSAAGWRLVRPGNAHPRDPGPGGPPWRFAVLSGPTHRVVLVGAGHVGDALASVLVPLGFRVEVVDERPGAAERLRGRAHGVRSVAYERLTDAVAPGPRTYVVVATHAPERDAAAVAALAGVRLGYLGVVGSPGKLARLGEVPGLEVPAGLPVGSHAPAEIAVSVAARLVAARSAHVVL